MFNRLLNFYRKTFWPTVKYARYLGVKIGEDCDIQKVSFGSEPYLVKVGNHVQITSGTKIFTHGGAWIFRKRHPDLDYFGKVVLKDNIYVGNNSLIMPGVTIGNDVIVAAGSVVTKSVAEGKIVAGNPARVVGDTNEYMNKIQNFDVGSKNMSYLQKKEFLLGLSDSKFIQK